MAVPPDGYVEPQLVWSVESEPDGDSGRAVGLGAFSTEAEARALLHRLAAEGRWPNLVLNMIPVHQWIEDWEWDR